MHTTLGWCISQQCFYFRSPGQAQQSPSWLCKKLFKKIKIQQIQFVMWQLAGFNYLSTYYVSYLLECFYYNYPRGHFHSHGQVGQSAIWLYKSSSRLRKKLFKKIKIQQIHWLAGCNYLSTYKVPNSCLLECTESGHTNQWWQGQSTESWCSRGHSSQH